MRQNHKYIFHLQRYVLCFLVSFLIIGCACQGDYVTKEKVGIFHISVTSAPEDADVYFNEKFIGKTPAKNLPIKIRYNVSCSGLLFSTTGWNAVAPSAKQYILVKKDGYKTAGGKLEFETNRDKLTLKQNNFYVDLLKE